MRGKSGKSLRSDDISKLVGKKRETLGVAKATEELRIQMKEFFFFFFFFFKRKRYKEKTKE